MYASVFHCFCFVYFEEILAYGMRRLAYNLENNIVSLKCIEFCKETPYVPFVFSKGQYMALP